MPLAIVGNQSQKNCATKTKVAQITMNLGKISEELNTLIKFILRSKGKLMIFEGFRSKTKAFSSLFQKWLI